MDPLGVYVRNLNKKLVVLDQSLSKIETGASSLLAFSSKTWLINWCSELRAQDSYGRVLGITRHARGVCEGACGGEGRCWGGGLNASVTRRAHEVRCLRKVWLAGRGR